MVKYFNRLLIWDKDSIKFAKYKCFNLEVIEFIFDSFRGDNSWNWFFFKVVFGDYSKAFEIKLWLLRVFIVSIPEIFFNLLDSKNFSDEIFGEIFKVDIKVVFVVLES